MNIVDIVIGAVLCVFLYRGFNKGMIREVAIIIGCIAGFYGGILFHEPLASLLEDFDLNLTVGALSLISFLVILAVVFFVSGYIGKKLKDSIKVDFLKNFDGMLGGVFGLVKGVILVSLILTGVNLFVKNVDMIDESKISGIIIEVSEEMNGFIPDGLKDEIKKKISGVKKNWD